MPRTIINYQNTLIYKLVCKDLNILDLYVGHTTDYKRRKSEHKRRCNGNYDKISNMKVYVIIRENGGWDNWEMIEIEKYPCNDSNEAIARERHWYEILNSSLNTQYPNRSAKEYCKQWEEKNKEKRKQQHIAYWELHKDKLSIIKNIRKKNRYSTDEAFRLKCLEKLKETYTCQCGVTQLKNGKSRHEKSKQHLKYLEEQKN
jgi:hypothetical protein